MNVWEALVTLEERTQVEEMVRMAASLFARGYSFGTAGNMSVRIGGTVYITPTNSSFETLTADDIAQMDVGGSVHGTNKPSTEAHLHLAAYRARRSAAAVVHLHSTYATAVSCLEDLNLEDAMPIYTPQYAMRLPRLPVVDYCPPGDPELASEVERRAAQSPAMLLRNHGIIAIGKSIREAAALAEEIEHQARLHLLLEGRGRRLSGAQVGEIRRRFQ
jgi:ribulose-5-phosphate 4-epimerase/fuculose-1-phosphate aldolase